MLTDTEKARRTLKSRVTRAFVELKRRGIRAEKNFECCLSCGTHRMLTEYTAAKTEWSNPNSIITMKPVHTVFPYGGVFYHAQDAERLNDRGSFNIAFTTWLGRFDGTQEVRFRRMTRVARMTVAVLRKYGVDARWYNDISRRIEVRGLIEDVAVEPMAIGL